MIKYEKYTSISGTDFIRRNNEDGSSSDIPMDEANSDYQRYLRWLENPNAKELTPAFPITTDTLTEQTQEGE